MKLKLRVRSTEEEGMMVSNSLKAGALMGLSVMLLFSFPQGARAQTRPAPPPPETIRFDEFFSKISVEGLEFSPKLKVLDGKQVRLVGYMVQQEHMSHGHFFLAARPLKLCPDCGGLTALPYDLVRVNVISAKPGTSLRYISGRVTLTGILSIGNREEADGTVSLIRLTLDPNLVADSIPARKEVKPSTLTQEPVNKLRR